jgi:hypothetical protein
MTTFVTHNSEPHVSSVQGNGLQGHLRRWCLCLLASSLTLGGCNRGGDRGQAPNGDAASSAVTADADSTQASDSPWASLPPEAREELLGAYDGAEEALSSFYASLAQVDAEVPPDRAAEDSMWAQMIDSRGPVADITAGWTAAMRYEAQAGREELLLERDDALGEHVHGIREPDTRSMLSTRLLVGDVVVEEKVSRRGSGKVGWATCEGNAPVIYYAARPDRRISPYTLVFFRAHEYAHHKLGHLLCGSGSARRLSSEEMRQREFDADCEAARTLLLHPDGDNVVFNALGTFSALDIPRTRTHPSTRERAERLINACD